MRSRLPICLVLAAGSLAAAQPAAANVPFSRLLSHTPKGKVPNAPATDVTISGDGRQARFAAFTSRATDIKGGKPLQKVFLVKRKRPYGSTGTRWREDRIVLVTKNANGDSWGPALDGFQDSSTHAPRCLAFVSRASNLVGSDPNGKVADVFIRRLTGGGGLRRVPGTGGASEVTLDGRCRHIAFVKKGRPYVATVGGGARAAGGSGARDLDLSDVGEALVYARRGGVWVSKPGSVRRLASGDHPTTDSLGRYVAFERGGRIVRGNLSGSVRVRRVSGRGASSPALSAGGTFVAYAVGALVRLSTYSNSKGDCETGSDSEAQAVGPRLSARGNYVVYSCAGGPAWLTYIGGQATGNPQ